MLSLAVATMLLGASTEREVEFATPDGLKLHGTLVQPAAEGQRAKAVLLLPGSGPTDRDGNQPGFQTDLLKSIAETLAKEGIASLRFDKRAAASNAPQWPKEISKLDAFFSYEHHVSDAAAALDALRAQPGIDGSHIGVAGHSEGGLIGLSLAAQESSKVQGLALLSTAARPLGVVIEEQVTALLQKQGASDAVRDKYLENLREAIAHVRRNGTRPPKVLPGLAAIFGPGTAKYWQRSLPLDPLQLLRRYQGPILVVQGEFDSQVSKDRDFPLFAPMVEAKKGVSVVVPGGSHNLKKAKNADDPGIQGPVVPAALDAIVAWADKI